MPCSVTCDKCEFLDKCGGEMEDESNEIRQCGESCGHYDSLNRCCWQSSNEGLYINIVEGDYCHFSYKERDYFS